MASDVSAQIAYTATSATTTTTTTIYPDSSATTPITTAIISTSTAISNQATAAAKTVLTTSAPSLTTLSAFLDTAHPSTTIVSSASTYSSAPATPATTMMTSSRTRAAKKATTSPGFETPETTTNSTLSEIVSTTPSTIAIEPTTSLIRVATLTTATMTFPTTQAVGKAETVLQSDIFRTTNTSSSSTERIAAKTTIGTSLTTFFMTISTTPERTATTSSKLTEQTTTVPRMVSPKTTMTSINSTPTATIATTKPTTTNAILTTTFPKQTALNPTISTKFSTIHTSDETTDVIERNAFKTTLTNVASSPAATAGTINSTRRVAVPLTFPTKTTLTTAPTLAATAAITSLSTNATIKLTKNASSTAEETATATAIVSLPNIIINSDTTIFKGHASPSTASARLNTENASSATFTNHTYRITNVSASELENLTSTTNKETTATNQTQFSSVAADLIESSKVSRVIHADSISNDDTQLFSSKYQQSSTAAFQKNTSFLLNVSLQFKEESMHQTKVTSEQSSDPIESSDTTFSTPKIFETRHRHSTATIEKMKFSSSLKIQGLASSTVIFDTEKNGFKSSLRAYLPSTKNAGPIISKAYTTAIEGTNKLEPGESSTPIISYTASRYSTSINEAGSDSSLSLSETSMKSPSDTRTYATTYLSKSNLYSSSVTSQETPAQETSSKRQLPSTTFFRKTSLTITSKEFSSRASSSKPMMTALLAANDAEEDVFGRNTPSTYSSSTSKGLVTWSDLRTLPEHPIKIQSSDTPSGTSAFEQLGKVSTHPDRATSLKEMIQMQTSPDSSSRTAIDDVTQEMESEKTALQTSSPINDFIKNTETFAEKTNTANLGANVSESGYWQSKLARYSKKFGDKNN
ncbi:unnamed protein product [Cylicocyclus nassatus]|uniref:Uncharacterized protein n=1 Tax=Cylicocyclus nassatus TaxID=53992 RepID=A0AA36H0W9_CYLNA|nr:unnamed protein product [Cylicocyclus nassatus]